jgi:steroid delta-isomerase
MVSDLVEAHVAAFNAAVRSGSYDAFVDGLAPDAVMICTGVPAGPFVGREAIRQAYVDQPPTDTLTALSVSSAVSSAVSPAVSGAVVRFAWAHGGTGTMRLAWSDGRVVRLEIAFD